MLLLMWSGLACTCLAQEFETITYPRADIKPEQVFTQETLEKSINYIFSWQQAAGAFGQLNLHSTWAVDGVIGRKYHGQDTSSNKRHIQSMLALYDETGDVKWKLYAEAIVANVMFLQAKSGGFYHGAAENEPAYNEGMTCAIHQGRPVLALLEYAKRPYADSELKAQIKMVIDKHHAWFTERFFKKGTRGVKDKSGWPWPCWSGVTNQDLVVIHSHALYGKVYGDMSRYENFAKPALDVLLSDRYYHKGLGLFQRGDNPSWLFPERTHYYYLVFGKLKEIYELTQDERIPPVLDDVCEQLFRATFVGPDGMRYFSHGVNVEKDGDSLKVLSYNKYPTSLPDCLALLPAFDWYLDRHPAADKQRIRDEIYKTAAAYVFANGTLPRALNPGKEIFAVSPNLYELPIFLFQHLKGNIKNFEIAAPQTVQRKINDVVWFEKGRFYSVEKDTDRTFAGFKLEPRAIVHGPDETLASVDFDESKTYAKNEKVIIEVMDIRFDENPRFTSKDHDTE